MFDLGVSKGAQSVVLLELNLNAHKYKIFL
jgi:hypothetical protein